MSRFTVVPVPGFGPEDVVVATGGPHEGAVYTGTEDGSILRVSSDGRRIERVARVAGRPLGLENGPDGLLLVCDATYGLHWLDPDTGRTELIVDHADGRPVRVCNNAAVASDGTIWFSDSSVRPLDRWRQDFVEVARTGRLLRLDPDGTVRTVLDGLAFANGVALAADESYVAVAESSTRTVVRHWLTGPQAGTSDHLVPDLPGYPDNIARGSDGLIWVALGSPVLPVVEVLHRGPRGLRRLVGRIPESLQPRPKRVVRVQAYDDAGRVVHDVDLDPRDHGASYHMVTGVREHRGRVWMGSLVEPAIACYDL